MFVHFGSACRLYDKGTWGLAVSLVAIPVSVRILRGRLSERGITDGIVFLFISQNI